jgi:tetratricopeptide (TPR) repeat protein
LFAICSFSQKDSANIFYQKALVEKETGRILEAWKNIDKAYKYRSDDITIINEYANILLELRRYKQAKEMFQKLEFYGVHSTSLYKQLLTLSFNIKQFDDAIIYAKKLKIADPAEKVNYYLGKIYYDRDNYGEAIKYLKASEKEDPQNAEVAYLISRCYADLMNYKLARPYLEKAIKLDSTKNIWIYELGLICYAMMADKDALNYILLAAEKGYKKDNDYLENLGIAYLNAGNMEEGVKILKEILERKPGDFNILNMIAEAYYYNKDYKEAINYWDQILFFDNTNAQSLFMIGICYIRRGEREKGIKLCDKAIEFDPNLNMYKQKRLAESF